MPVPNYPELPELNDTSRRERRMELFREEIQDTVDEIRARLEEGGAGKILLSKLWSVGLAVLGVSEPVGLLHAIGRAFKGSQQEPRSLPLAYAARAQIGLLGVGQT